MLNENNSKLILCIFSKIEKGGIVKFLISLSSQKANHLTM